jgi:precorrin-6B methylase 2
MPGRKPVLLPRVEVLSPDPVNPVRLMVIDHLAHGIGAAQMPQTQFTVHTAMLDALSRLRATRADFTSFHIGGGTYSVPRAFASHGAGAITVAEIDPAVTQMAVESFWFDPATATILHEDARRALLSRPDARYDVILGDAFTDVVVPVHLVTREFFQLAADRLNPGGSFLMNVIDYEDRLHALSSIVATLGEVFPVVEVWTRQAQPLPARAWSSWSRPAMRRPAPTASRSLPPTRPALARWPTAWCMSSPRRAGAS